ncbi:MAG TPA: hypothetical protein VHA74_00395 [Candidatus Dojkabacteria bacterium]|nr:hypothetical protein [Candidatus Dojkabacteria bacterium]
MKKKLSVTNDKNNVVNNDKLEFFIEAIARFCDKCGASYSVDDLQLIQESDYSSIIHFTCKNCKSRHIATFIKPIGLSSRMPINSDLNVKEIGKFASKSVIPADDILDVYTLLNKKRMIKL